MKIREIQEPAKAISGSPMLAATIQPPTQTQGPNPEDPELPIIIELKSQADETVWQSQFLRSLTTEFEGNLFVEMLAEGNEHMLAMRSTGLYL